MLLNIPGAPPFITSGMGPSPTTSRGRRGKSNGQAGPFASQLGDTCTTYIQNFLQKWNPAKYGLKWNPRKSRDFLFVVWDCVFLLCWILCVKFQDFGGVVLERVYIRSTPLNVRFFGGGENHLKEWLVVPGFAGDYKGALFDLGVKIKSDTRR